MAYWKGSASSHTISTTWYTWEIGGLPANCLLAELVVLLTDIDGASSATVFVSHDDDGLLGVVPFVTASATQLINVRDEPAPEALGSGFVAFSLGAVWFSENGENPRVHCKLDGGTAMATPRLTAYRGSLP